MAKAAPKKKTAGKKAAVKKIAPKKAAPPEIAPKKAASKKAVSKKTVSKKAVSKKTGAATAPAKHPVGRSPAKQAAAPAKRPVGRPPGKKAAAAAAPAKRPAGRPAGKKAAAPAKRLVGRPPGKKAAAATKVDAKNVAKRPIGRPPSKKAAAPARRPVGRPPGRKAAIAKTVIRRPSAAVTMPRLRASAPEQAFHASHLNEADFKADGLRHYAQYRDLGIVLASGGLCQAHVIRLIPPCTDEVRKRHVHETELQLIYVLKGWIKNEFEGHGVQMMSAGSCWLQPPGIEHTVLDYSADCEMLEIIVPADFKTTEVA